MGPLTVRRSSPTTWGAAAGSMVVAAAAMALVVAPVEDAPALVIGAVAVIVVLAIGLAGGWPAVAATSSCAQVGVVAWAAALDDDLAVGTQAILVALGVWLAFELACTSFETRGDVEVTTAVRWSRATDLVGVAALGGIVAAVALAFAASGPDGDVLLLRSGGLLLAAGVVGGLVLLSRRLRTR